MLPQTRKLCLKNTFIDPDSEGESLAADPARAQSEPGIGWRPSEHFFQDEVEYVGSLNDRAEDTFPGRADSREPSESERLDGTVESVVKRDPETGQWQDVAGSEGSAAGIFGSSADRDLADVDELSMPGSSCRSVNDSAGSLLGADSESDSPPPSAVGSSAAGSPAAANPGSAGHPNLCRRPCRFFTAGKCRAPDACKYCHVPHNTIPSFNHLNTRTRDLLRRLPDEKKCAVLAAAMREKAVEMQLSALGLEAVEAWVAELHAACGAELDGGALEDVECPEDPHLRRTIAYLSGLGVRGLCNLARGKLHHPGVSDACRRLLDRLNTAILEGGRASQ